MNRSFFKPHLLFTLLIILIFSLFACQKLLNPQLYTSHDGEGHVIRLIEFDASLHDGQFPVRLAKRINHGLGYPYFNFNYPFIYYAGTALHATGLSYVDSFKALLILSVMFGGIGVFLFCSYFFGRVSSLTASIFYIFVPYRFLNMYVRGAVAEAFALGVLPLLFLAIELLIRRKKGSVPFFIIVFSILITSHNITAFFTAPLLTLYFLLRILKEKRKRDLIKKYAFVFLVSACLTAFFWFPALYESGLTKLIELTEDYKAFFPSVSEIIYSPWGFGAYVQGNALGKMSPQIGIVHVGVVILALGFLLARFSKKKYEEKDFLFLGFIVVALICFFLLFPFSMFLWDHIYFLQLVQQPWRLVGYIVLSTSIAAGYLISLIRNKKIQIIVSIVIILALLYTTRNQVRVNMYVPFNNPFEHSQVYGPSTTSKDEHMPRLAPRVYTDPNLNGDLIASFSGTSVRTVWKSNYHRFNLDLKQDAQFRDNTSYFPGWTGFVDGKKVPILYANDEFYRLRVKVPKGNHIVEFRFGETWYRIAADLISLGTFIVVCGVLVTSKFGKKK